MVTADKGIGVIDFNDMVKACRVFELGHLLCYMLLSHDCDLKVQDFAIRRKKFRFCRDES